MGISYKCKEEIDLPKEKKMAKRRPIREWYKEVNNSTTRVLVIAYRTVAVAMNNAEYKSAEWYKWKESVDAIRENAERHGYFIGKQYWNQKELKCYDHKWYRACQNREV